MRRCWRRRKRVPHITFDGIMGMIALAKMVSDIKEKGRQEGIKECKKALEELEE